MKIDMNPIEIVIVPSAAFALFVVTMLAAIGILCWIIGQLKNAIVNTRRRRAQDRLKKARYEIMQRSARNQTISVNDLRKMYDMPSYDTSQR